MNPLKFYFRGACSRESAPLLIFFFQFLLDFFSKIFVCNKKNPYICNINLITN